MVFYYTSPNVRMMRNILLDYQASTEITPYEYMKIYVEKSPEHIEDAKLSWIAETFLGIKKHEEFLRGVTMQIAQEVSDEESTYVMIILYGVIFQVPVKDMQLLYKCLFNLSKVVLNQFTTFLSNEDSLSLISEVAQKDYDAVYITEKIIKPLFEWQPHMGDLAQNYTEYVQKIEARKIKPLTVPLHPNVLNRKGKEIKEAPTSLKPFQPSTPPNSLRTKMKMLTKSAIDRRLQTIHEKNKQRAARLLSDVKKKKFRYAQEKLPDSEEVLLNREKIATIPKQKLKFMVKYPTVAVKENVATVKRLSKRIQMTEQDELKWLENILCDNSKIDQIIANDRQEKEKERLLDIEKKHLLGQITHEEAVIAKKKLLEDNKKKYEEYLKEKEIWDAEIENWKQAELEKCRKQVERLSLIELAAMEAKAANIKKKKEYADGVRKESEELINIILKVRQEELERKINMIKEVKILSIIANKSKVPKIIDLTETSGFGLLCEMSIAELQERLNSMKISMKEELDKRKAMIKEENEAAKRQLEEEKNNIKDFNADRASRKPTKASNTPITIKSKELTDLKKMLDEKRKLRVKLSS